VYTHLVSDDPAKFIGNDLAKLRQDHPAWCFGSVWISAGSGPDARRLWAARDGLLLSAWMTRAGQLRALGHSWRVARMRHPDRQWNS
jgi:hypothetical protein